MDIFILITTLAFLVIILSIYMLFRNNWVYKVRIAAIETKLYDELISYEDMLNKHVFTYDTNKMIKN